MGLHSLHDILRADNSRANDSYWRHVRDHAVWILACLMTVAAFRKVMPVITMILALSAMVGMFFEKGENA